jgi:hypothetical protein
MTEKTVVILNEGTGYVAGTADSLEEAVAKASVLVAAERAGFLLFVAVKRIAPQPVVIEATDLQDVAPAANPAVKAIG